MTILTKEVTRKTVGTYQFGGFKSQLLATLAPGDVLQLREAGRGKNQTYYLSLEALYRQAVLGQVLAEKELRKSNKSK